MRGSYDFEQMMCVGLDASDIVPTQIFEPDGNDVDAVCIARELAAGIEQGLLDLVVRREQDLEIQVQVASPESNDWL